MALRELAKRNKLEYIKNYTKDSYKRFLIYVSYSKEKEIIDLLLTKDSISGYIKELILKDIKVNGE